MENFEAILEEYLIESEPQIGSLVEGVILKVDRNYAFVDIGSKREALLPKDELIDAYGRTIFRVGDTVKALVVRRLSPEGQVLLSVRKILEEKALETLRKAFSQKEPVKVKIHREVKGGYEVKFEGLITGFLPRSQVLRTEDPFQGDEIEVLVIQVGERAFVVSQRAFAEAVKERKLKEIVKIIEEDGILEGKVKARVKGGFLIDFEGVLTGFLPFSELTRRRILPDETPISEGDTLKVKAIEWDPVKRKLKVSHKVLEADPWKYVHERYTVDQRVRCRVVKVENFGAFVEIEPGLEGLLPASEISWKRGVKPGDIVQVGDLIEAIITDIDPEKRKLTLSLKRLEPSPWEILAQELKEGDIVEGPIKTVTDFGLFVEVREGVDGFIHASRVSWERIENLQEIFKPGQIVRAKVIEIDTQKRRLLLSIKDLLTDPWQDFCEAYKTGDVVEGLLVKQIPGKGYLVRIKEGIVGLLPRSEISRERRVKGSFDSEEKVKLLIIELEPSQRRLILSEKAYQEKIEEEDYLAYKSREEASKKGRIIKIALDKENS